MAYAIELEMTDITYGREKVDSTSFWVEENVPTGLRLAEITNYDAGVVTFRFKTQSGVLLNNDGRYGLEKDAETGKWYLTVADGSKFDWEDLTTHEGIVLEGVNASNIVVDEATIQTYIVDVEPETAPNAAPVIDAVAAAENGTAGTTGAEAGKIVVLENAGTGVVAQVTAHDNDVGQTITYSLASTFNGLFAIGADGKISIADASKLPVNADTDYVLTVNVSDGNGGTDAETVTIRVKNVNQAPVIDSVAASGKGDAGAGGEFGLILINENEGAGIVAKVTAHDNDAQAINYSLGGANGTYGNLFSIDTDGNISITDPAALDLNADQDYVLTVVASDGLAQETREVTIRVKNVAPANTAPVIDAVAAAENGTAGAGAEAGKIVVLENAGTGVVAQVAAHDNDVGQTITYSLASTFNGLFAIGADGKISIADASKLPVNADTDYVLTVNVSDGNGGTDAETVTIRVKNVNQAPVITGVVAAGKGEAGAGADAGTFVIYENEGAGVVADVDATDGDGTALQYSLVGTNGNHGGLFSIAADGKISITDPAALNLNADKDYVLTVQVSDGMATKTQDVTIRVKNVAPGNAAPTAPVVQAGSALAANENVGGVVVATVNSTDDPTQTLTYSLESTFNGLFAINAASGAITLTGPVDFEGAVPGLQTGTGADAGKKYFELQVKATDNGDPALSSATSTVKVYINNVNERPNTATYTAGAEITEQAEEGTVVGTIGATDPDGTAPGFKFENALNGSNGLVSGDGAFKIVFVGGMYQIQVNNPAAIAVTGGAPTKVFNYTVVSTDGTLDAAVPTPVSITVHDVPGVNAAPVITVDPELDTTGAWDTGASVSPFLGVTIADADAAADEVMTLKIEFAQDDGTLEFGATPLAYTDLAGRRTYTFTGTLADLRARLEGLKFNPKDRAAAGDDVATDFLLTLTDGYGAADTDNAVKVVTKITGNAFPEIEVDPGMDSTPTVDINGAINPFKGVELVDSDNLTVTIRFAKADGALVVPAGLEDFCDLDEVVETAGGDLIYTFTGIASELRVIMDILRFDSAPRPGAAAGTVHTTKFKIGVVDNMHPGAAETVHEVEVESITGKVALDTALALEDADTGTAVGKLTAAAGDYAFTYELLNDAGGRFALAADGKTIVVKNGLLLDYEQAWAHTIQLKVKVAGEEFVQNLTIGVADVALENVLGSAANERFVGGAGRDALNGGFGNDVLVGGYSNDYLVGGSGSDVFVFNAKLGSSKTDRKVNFDRIVDFNVAADTIQLENKIFTKLKKTKTLNKKYFVSGSAAKDKDDYIGYDKKKGVVWYDSDGSGSKAAIEIAQLSKNLKLTYKDFYII